MQQIQLAKQNNQRVLLHCYHGSDRTGASVAMYRIIFENWAIDDAVKEMKQGVMVIILFGRILTVYLALKM